MKTRGIFKLHKYFIDIDDWGKRRNKPIYLIPVGDIHRDSDLCAKEKFMEFINWGKTQDDCYYIGVGDWLDMLSSTERHAYESSKYHDTTRKNIEAMCDKKIDNLVEELSFMKGKLIGIMEGNHYFKYVSGTTSDEKLCDKFDCTFLGVCTFIRLIIRDKNKHSAAIDVYLHHGEGGGRTIGASMGKLENSAKGKLADIYIMGHDHAKGAVPRARLCLTDSRRSLRLVQKKVLYVRSGGFLRGYVNGKESYIVDGNYNPTDIGVVKISLTPKRDKFDNRYIDIHASV